MLRNLLIVFLFFFCVSQVSFAQSCTTLGQTPGTAFPVCGTTTFNQGSVPICSGRPMVSKCTDITYQDKNPYWYKFTCFASGTLGFVITPINISDDYDWQLFDVTGRNVEDVYSNIALFVACNWSAEGGETGASAAGTSLVRCQGFGVPLFSTMPTLTTGHNYLLMISHFTDSQVGYSLSFGGGTADITDPLPPHMLSAMANCDGTRISIKLNKKMKCNSLATDGSDFSINDASTSITSATGEGCTRGFDMDSATLTLNNPLLPGNYIITIRNGNDGNTLLDNCGRNIPADETVPLAILPLLPTPMDSLTKPGCAPSTLQLVFKKPIRCNSIAPDGSDFSVTGTYPVSISGAAGSCTNGIATTITVQLSEPLQTAGNFVITLKKGTDGNTLIDDCSQETPAGSSLPFTIADTVNADFAYPITYSCSEDIIHYAHNGANQVNSWHWNFGTAQSEEQHPVISYVNFEPKHTTLIVSNGVCSDTSRVNIIFDNYLDARFEATALVCPGDEVIIKNKTVGNIAAWHWDFGNGNISGVKDPSPQVYPIKDITYNEIIRLYATNNYGCSDTAFQFVKVIDNCYIAVPSAFTPNGDGVNDYLYPLNAYKAANLSFSVYNRFGQRLWYTTDWTQKWDGRMNGQGADPGTYVWILNYTNTETNRIVSQKGTTILIR